MLWMSIVVVMILIALLLCGSCSDGSRRHLARSSSATSCRSRAGSPAPNARFARAAIVREGDRRRSAPRGAASRVASRAALRAGWQAERSAPARRAIARNLRSASPPHSCNTDGARRSRAALAEQETPSNRRIRSCGKRSRRVATSSREAAPGLDARLASGGGHDDSELATSLA